jgi:N-formylglutamate deformylase
MQKATYQLELPENRTTSVIFASPHSGRSYPWAFLRKSVLDELAIRSSEDAFVDLLFADVPSFGAPLLAAHAPRAFVDLNRSRDELDPALIDGVPRSGLNPRVASGLGVIPRVVSSGRQIYRGKLSKHEADLRLTQYWQPYHDVLEGLVAENCRMFGQAVLIDCHSMPHEAIDSINRRNGPRAEVVLGDRYGAAANSNIVDRIEAAFVAAGLTVVRNMPFAGAYVAQHYGRPSLNRHAVQIEIDRSLYMNEKLIRPNGNFRSFQKMIASIASEISDIGRREQPLAAE